MKFGQLKGLVFSPEGLKGPGAQIERFFESPLVFEFQALIVPGNASHARAPKLDRAIEWIRKPKQLASAQGPFIEGYRCFAVAQNLFRPGAHEIYVNGGRELAVQLVQYREGFRSPARAGQHSSQKVSCSGDSGRLPQGFLGFWSILLAQVIFPDPVPAQVN